MSLIIQDMLFLSQADRGAQARREPVQSLAEIARPVADLHEAALEDAMHQLIETDLTLRSCSRAPAMALMERMLLRLCMMPRGGR